MRKSEVQTWSEDERISILVYYILVYYFGILSYGWLSGVFRGCHLT